MPAPIASGDRKILLLAGAILVVLTAGLAFLGGDTEEQGVPIPSTYSAGPGGARAAYLLLQELHYKVSRWEKSPTELSGDPEGTVLILAEPFETPTKEETEALRKFVEQGGQVIFTGARIKSFFPKSKVGEDGMENLLGGCSEQLHGRRSKDCFPDGHELARARSQSAPAVWRDTLSGSCKLANGRRQNFMVGGGHAADEFRNLARKQPEFFPRCDERSSWGRYVSHTHLLG